MKKILILLLLLLCSIISYSQNTGDPDSRITYDTIKTNTINDKTAACGTPWVSGGYPNWTNYWAGYQFNIVNTSGGPLMINSFEARFQGTSGYRIYTKVGTFIGFETNAGAWTLVGAIGGGLTGLGTTIPTPIPIPVSICIPIGGTQAFYLTRTDNTAANRHLYVPGTGTAGTTIYASDANIGITEAYYVSPFFATLYAQTRRPSIDVCYSLSCVLPIELKIFHGYNKGGVNHLKWVTSTEINNDFFTLERSFNGINWFVMTEIDGTGNSNVEMSYGFQDDSFTTGVNYYRLSQTDFNGTIEILSVISIDNSFSVGKQIVKVINLLGQDVDEDYDGIKVIIYDDGTRERKK